MDIHLGWWILPLIVTIFALRWAFKDEFTRGDFNPSTLFTVPTAAFVSMTAWAAYFGAMWALT